MFTIDRINAVREFYGLPAVQRNLHQALNEIDTEAGRDTQGALVKVHWSATPIPINPLGYRLAYHERRLHLSDLPIAAE